MKDKRLLTTVSAIAFAVGLGISVAQAGEPPMAPSSWAGFYAGLHAGYGNADFDVDDASGDSGVDVFENAANGVDGGLVGFHVGYNWEFDGLVAGIEGDVDWLVDWDTRGNGTDTSDDARGDMDYLASIRGRLGMVIDSDTLIFVTGGVAFTDSDQTIHAGSSTQQPFDHDVGGVIGVGLAHKVSHNLSIRGEALYYIFGEESYDAASTSPEGDVDLNVFTVRIGASYHF